MTPEYYEGVVLSTINSQLKDGKCGLNTIAKLTGMNKTTIVKAIRRLEERGRLRANRDTSKPTRYKVLDPPNQYDMLACSLHMESRLGREN